MQQRWPELLHLQIHVLNVVPCGRFVTELIDWRAAIPANRRRESRQIAGAMRNFYAFTYQDREIWGATAAIVVNLAQRLSDMVES